MVKNEIQHTLILKFSFIFKSSKFALKLIKNLLNKIVIKNYKKINLTRFKT